MKLTFQPVSAVDLDTLTQAYNHAYQDYVVPVHATPGTIQALQTAVDVDFDASVVAYQDDHIVGFGFLGIRDQRGWISSVAVQPEARGQGIGRAIMDELTANAQARGLTHLQLEVNAENEPARRLYDGLGFHIRRQVVIAGSDQPPRDVDTIDIKQVHPRHLLPHHQRLHPTRPTWQREQASMRFMARGRAGWKTGKPLSAYLIGGMYDRVLTFDDLACAPDAEDDLRRLVATLHRRYPDAICRVQNLATDEPGWAVLESLGYEVVLTELEMVKTL